MKIFESAQVKAADDYTIKYEPITSVDLMERAATKLFDWFIDKYPKNKKIAIFVGPGNNGGDGLVLARLLHNATYKVDVLDLNIRTNYSDDFLINKKRLEKLDPSIIKIWGNQDISNYDLIVDAIFGSGLTRAIEGDLAKVISRINEFEDDIIAIDIPSGLFGEDNSRNIKSNIVKANFTLTFQFPKLAFLLPDNEEYVGKFTVLNIGIHPNYIANTYSKYYLTKREDIGLDVFTRKQFSHKGTYGHALIFAGSRGKMGASILANKACLRSGIGLLSTLVSDKEMSILQVASPESMCIPFSDISKTNLSNFSTIALGPGIGQSKQSLEILSDIISNYNKAIVLDADALNLIAKNPKLLDKLSKNSILTPHPKELERLIGETNDHYSRLIETQILAKKYEIYVLIKGAFSVIVCPNGEFHFNTTGNPGMATAGSGDVLTGIVTALLSQGLNSFEALKTAVYIHGLAGDIAKSKLGELSLISTDIIENIASALQTFSE